MGPNRIARSRLTLGADNHESRDGAQKINYISSCPVELDSSFLGVFIT